MQVIVYTDGSCVPNPGKGGWGYVALYNDTEFQDSGKSEYSTNNIMELTAVIEALKCFSECKNFIIRSDSQYVIGCATGIFKIKKNIELWEEYKKLASNKNIKFEKVKGHGDDYYNNIADKLAGEKN